MKGKLVVISGFSGAGKGTVIQRLREVYDGYVLSVSMTTRKPRPGEVDGVHYHYVTNEAFEDLVRNNGLLEHAGYADHYYGTPRAFVEENIAAGRDVLLEIEVQGAMQVRKLFPEAVLIFISPQDAWELEDRLMGRGTESEETVTKRLNQATAECDYIPDYDYLLINNDVDRCMSFLNRIIRGDRESDSAEVFDEEKYKEEVITGSRLKTAFAADFLWGLTEILAARGGLF